MCLMWMVFSGGGIEGLRFVGQRRSQSLTCLISRALSR